MTGAMTDLPVPAAFPVTGFAVGNALGTNVQEVARALEEGRSGLGPCPWDLPFETLCGVFPGPLEPLPRSLSAHDTRLARMALTILSGLDAEVARAVRRWGRDRLALVMGTSTGGILETEGAYQTRAVAGSLPEGFDLDRQHAFHGVLEVLRARTGATGPAYVVSTACSSSGKVLASARRLIASGVADAVLTGGVDTLCHTTLRGFESLQALSRRACRPFSADRDGLSIGEGGAFLLIERDGEGRVLLRGVGESSDAFHMSHPHPDGLGARLAMEAALRQAGIEADSVDHVNAHGTGTVANDVVEASAIAAVVGRGALVTSTKSYTGHLLGAAGATEAVLAALAIERGFVPATIGAEPLDPRIQIDVCVKGTKRPVRTAMSNSFAFGGSNVSVLLGACG
jgi:3-oxoacyl-[acyl-carrier-protein] synthase-1